MTEQGTELRILRLTDSHTPGPPRVIALLEGELNVNEVIACPSGNTLRAERIRRHPKRNTRIFQALAHEYDSIGFTSEGGKFRRRSPEEQVRFTDHCITLGLKVLPVRPNDHHILESTFLHNAQKFDDYLLHATPDEANRVTLETFLDLFKAHRNGITYGDRWAENILVVPRIGIVNIDFDIDISGPHAREFEAAQVATYVIGGSKKAALPLLSRLLTSAQANLDIRYLHRFLWGHAQYYDADHKYGSIDNELTTLLALMHKEHEQRNST